MRLFFTLYNDIFNDHWGFVPLDIDEMMGRFGAKQLKWIIKPQLFLFVEDKGKPIGFRWSLPNYSPLFKEFNGKLGPLEMIKFIINSRKLQQGKFITMGLKKKYRRKGIGTYLNYLTLRSMKKLGYKTAEYGWIDEKNIASHKAGEKIGGKLYKKYRIFSKMI
jgi:predicted acetyltransferase